MKKIKKYIIGLHIIFFLTILTSSTQDLLEHHYNNKMMNICQEKCQEYNCCSKTIGFTYGKDSNGIIKDVECDCKINYAKIFPEISKIGYFELMIAQKEDLPSNYNCKYIADVNMTDDKLFVELILKDEKMRDMYVKYPFLLSIMRVDDVFIIMVLYALLTLCSAIIINKSEGVYKDNNKK